jgi:Na+/phosphate symporter
MMEVDMALKEQVFEMHDLISDMVESIDSLYAGFIYNNLKVVEEVESTLNGAAGRLSALTEGVVGEAKEGPRASSYVSVPSHVGRIGDGLSRIAESLVGKIKGNILFSDKATAELDYLFGRTRDIMVNARDMVLAPNTLVAMHMAESGQAVEKIADEYATKHEERLIEGLCAPKASQIYIQMLDAFKSIAWHAKEIAKDLSG